jgi:hypothetical protein
MRIGIWPGSQVAKATVCKTVIRECNSRPGLRLCRGGGMAYAIDLKSIGIISRVGSSPTRGTKHKNRPC